VNILAVPELTNFLQLSFAGLALGCLYALVALGFVVIYKSTGVINFAQGGLVLLGGYVTYDAHQTLKMPFAVAVLMAVAVVALAGALIQQLVLRRMVGQPVFAVVMVTIGLLFVIEVVQQRVWGPSNLNMGDPWGIKTVTAGDVALQQKDMWTIGLTLAVLGIFFTFFRYSRLGLAMRAAAVDQEAAIAQGISARRIFTLSWAIAGAVATLAGVLLMSGAAQVSPAIEFVALVAFPAIILGGLDSPLGAVVGGILIGLAQVLTSGYQPRFSWLHWLGGGFGGVMPYVVMILILMVRPYGLFGTKEVRRV
jgi:branched-chain amino acid transport system permease protein